MDDATATRDDINSTDRLERAFLASLMLLDRAATWGKVSTLVPVEAMAREAHRAIYTAIREVAKVADPDLTLTIAQLADTGQLERAGGAAYVAGILDEGPCVDSLVEYGKRIKARSVLRRAKGTR